MNQHQQSNLHVEGRDEGKKRVKNRKKAMRESDRNGEENIVAIKS